MADNAAIGIGLVLPTWPLRGGGHASWPELRGLARDVEALGVDTLWVPDHLLRVVRDRPPFGFWECWTILTAAAEATTSIEIGPLIACTGFRNPALLAKMAVTLDEVSGGRLILGLGSGVPATDASWRTFGYDGQKHVGQHEEAVEIIARLLREPPVTFAGEHHRVEEAQILPRGPRLAGPPIWVAGKGDRTLRIAARWADAINVNTAIATAADVVAMTERVAGACAVAGRDPATLAITGWGRISILPDGTAGPRPGWLGGTPEAAAETVRAMHEAGLRHLTLYVGDTDDPSPMPALRRETLERFAPFLEAIRAA